MLPYFERYYKSVRPVNLTEEQKAKFRQEVKEELLKLDNVTEEEAERISRGVSDVEIANAVRGNYGPKEYAPGLIF